MAVLDGRVALVTGGGTGLGRAVCLAFAREGCSVAVNYAHSERDAQQTAEDICALGRRGIALKADVAVDSEVRTMVQSTVDQFGALDILVNNARTTRFATRDDLASLIGAERRDIDGGHPTRLVR